MTVRAPSPVKSPSVSVALVPSRCFGVLNAAVSRGQMVSSNSRISPPICASVTSVEEAGRQSPAGNATSSATQTSMCLPTPRSV
nr:hypothetical protein GCM10020092_055240 [Actinoplanes digitatis]